MTEPAALSLAGGENHLPAFVGCLAEEGEQHIGVLGGEREVRDRAAHIRLPHAYQRTFRSHAAA